MEISIIKKPLSTKPLPEKLVLKPRRVRKVSHLFKPPQPLPTPPVPPQLEENEEEKPTPLVPIDWEAVKKAKNQI